MSDKVLVMACPSCVDTGRAVLACECVGTGLVGVPPTVSVELTEEELAGMLDPPASAHIWVQRVRPKIQAALAKLRGER